MSRETTWSAVAGLRVAIFQAAPMSLSINAGMRDLFKRAQSLAASGIALAAFGESFIGGYPLWSMSHPEPRCGRLKRRRRYTAFSFPERYGQAICGLTPSRRSQMRAAC